MKKNVFITGVFGTTGVALAREFRENGYYVYGVDDKEDFEGTCDRAIRFDINQFVSDAGYRIRFTQIFDEIIPRLDVLINNAEVKKLGRLNEIRLEDWEETLNVNLTGPMMLSKLFLKRLTVVNGAILNVGSIHQNLTAPEHVAYSTSMNAMHGLTKAMAVDLKGKVQVNSISLASGTTVQSGQIPDEQVQNLELEYAEELSKMAVYLVSMESKLLHGVNIQMDGGAFLGIERGRRK